jgi:hypothetical protein
MQKKRFVYGLLTLFICILLLPGYKNKDQGFVPCYRFTLLNTSSSVSIDYVQAGTVYEDYGPDGPISPGNQTSFGFNQTPITTVIICVYFSSSPGGSIKVKQAGTLISCFNVTSTYCCFNVNVPGHCLPYTIEYSDSSC